MKPGHSLFGPLCLIAVGGIWILIGVGKIPLSNLWALAYLWPFLLIAAGAGLMLSSVWKYASPVVSMIVIAGVFLAVIDASALQWNHAPYDLGAGAGWMEAGPRGSGNVVTQIRPQPPFRSIRLLYPAEIILQQGDAESVSVMAEDNVATNIQTQVADGVLVIGQANAEPLHIVPTKPVNIEVNFRNLSQIDFETAGEARLNGLEADALTVIMNGAGKMDLNHLSLNTFHCNLAGAGSITASGTARSIDLQMDGLGSFDAQNLRSQDAIVRLDGLGSATVWASTTLSAQLSGLGSIIYYGSPRLTQSVDGLGSIQHAGDK